MGSVPPAATRGETGARVESARCKRRGYHELARTWAVPIKVYGVWRAVVPAASVHVVHWLRHGHMQVVRWSRVAGGAAARVHRGWRAEAPCRRSRCIAPSVERRRRNQRRRWTCCRQSTDRSMWYGLPASHARWRSPLPSGCSRGSRHLQRSSSGCRPMTMEAPRRGGCRAASGSCRLRRLCSHRQVTRHWQRLRFSRGSFDR